MSLTPKFCRAAVACCLLSLTGCTLNLSGAHDAEKAMLYVHLMAADLELLANSTFEAGDDWDLLDGDIKQMQAAAQKLPGDRKQVRTLVDESARAVTAFDQAMPVVKAGHAASDSFIARAQEVMAKWDEVLRGMAESGASAEQLMIANRQVVLVDRMTRRSNEVLRGGEVATSAADAFARDMEVYRLVLDGMKSGNPEIGVDKVRSERAQAVLGDLQALQAKQATDAQRVLESLTAVHAAQDSADRLRVLRHALMDAAPPRY